MDHTHQDSTNKISIKILLFLNIYNDTFLAGIILGKLFLADKYDKCSLKWSNCLHILFDLIGVGAVAFWQ
jgi:hypothetical protein